MSAPGSNLSNTELMHVALHANAQGKPQETIHALKQILERDADDAKALYLLGAVHAEIGMFDDAVTEMARAVAIDPSLLTAHFQLGLLHYTANRFDDAAIAWRPLDELPKENVFFLFKDGMLALADGRYDDAFATIESGIAGNDFNPALNNDMQRMIDNARQRMKKMGIAGATDELDAALKMTASARTASSLSAYSSNDVDQDK